MLVSVSASVNFLDGTKIEQQRIALAVYPLMSVHCPSACSHSANPTSFWQVVLFRFGLDDSNSVASAIPCLSQISNDSERHLGVPKISTSRRPRVADVRFGWMLPAEDTSRLIEWRIFIEQLRATLLLPSPSHTSPARDDVPMNNARTPVNDADEMSAHSKDDQSVNVDSDHRLPSKTTSTTTTRPELWAFYIYYVVHIHI